MFCSLIFACPADRVPDWRPRILLGMVEARSFDVGNIDPYYSGVGHRAKYYSSNGLATNTLNVWGMLRRSRLHTQTQEPR